jgi:hypothetical protein
MNHLFLIRTLGIPLFVAFTTGVPHTSPIAQPAESYAVYSVLIPHITSVAQKKFLVVAHTITYADTRSRFPVEPENLISREEFDRRVARAIPLDRIKTLRSEPCVLAPDAERETYLSAMRDYRRKNETSVPLERKLDLPAAYELAITTGVKPDDWTEIAEAKGVDGLFELSAVGFSADMTLAIVYAGFDCPLCGRWALHILKKTDGKWKEVASGCSRMS